MQFEVRRAPLSLRRTYTVRINGLIAFAATATLFRLLPSIDVADRTGRTAVSIQRRLSFLRAVYDFDVGRKKLYPFRTQSLWRAVYTLETDDGTVTVYGHRGRTHSIYRGDRQVAYFEKRRVSVLDGATYTGLADDDEDAALIASIVIAIDDYWSRNSDDATVSVDYGSVGPQAKPFNPQWRPSPQSPQLTETS